MKKSRWNSFHFAVAKGHKEVAEFLLSKNINLKRIETRDGKSPLQLAALTKKLDICRWLVQEGVELETLLGKQKIREYLVCKDYFLMLQSDVKKKDESGKTALHCAAEYGHLDLVRELIDLGAEIEATDHNGWNVAHFACKGFLKCEIFDHEYVNIIELLLESSGKLACQKTNDGRTVLHILSNHYQRFVCIRDHKLVRFLVEYAEVDGKLHLAAKKGDLALVQQLIESGADLNAADHKGKTALMRASKLNKSDVIAFLLERNADLKRKDEKGRNAVHHALPNLEIAKMLHRKDESLVREVTKSGNTSLHLALKTGSMEVIHWLVIDIKIDVNAANNCGRTALIDACSRNFQEAAEFLLKMNADLHMVDKWGHTALFWAVSEKRLNLIQMLFEKGAQVNGCKNLLRYALYDFNIVRFFHERHPDSMKDKKGNTLLHIAATCYFPQCPFDVLRWLVEGGQIDLEARNNDGETPLLAACKEGRWEVVDFLLNKNADATRKDNEGKSALDYAPFLML
ncbi:Hypothetical predicted protein [Cloeon dipterum]|uniref:Uncharacterized protein n=1 Tax=Cloeon dipterum TaxID=197152 RepID=A0A8S1DSJ7_9INSE|nr:Hypothetical predicted protein [Cloeon dipterum]